MRGPLWATLCASEIEVLVRFDFVLWDAVFRRCQNSQKYDLLKLSIVEYVVYWNIRTSFNKSAASRSAGSPARAAELAFDRKTVKYEAQFGANSDRPSRKFVPLAVTTLGVWDERSMRWLRRFSEVCAAATAKDTGQVFAALMIRLSVALWRGISQMLRACRPYSTELSDADF